MLVLADGSMYGYEKVARTIINIDPALEAEDINPWDYTTLWARYIRLNASSWIMKMRDYPREMIKARVVKWAQNPIVLFAKLRKPQFHKLRKL